MTVSTNLRDRERFDALRRQMFRQMALAGKRWGLSWWVAVGLLVLVMMLVRGASPARLGLQIGAVALAIPSLVHRMRHPTHADHGQSLLSGMLLFIACVVNTGGCSSPLAIMSIPMLFGAALIPMPNQVRGVLFGAFLFAFMSMVLASTGAVGELGPASTTALRFAPSTYVALSIAVGVFVVVVVYYQGKSISLVYERVALELASRREELCYESEDRTRALEGIAARMAHEVKNPLAAIKGLSAHMARSATDPKVAERLAIVAAEADRLKEIVDGFLSFSRGLDEMKVAPMRPFELAHELSVLLEVRAAEAGITLEVTGNQTLELNADRRKLRQVLLNLVLNAIQASPRDKTVRVDVRGPACGGGATIQVIDYGAGMSAETIERIRRPYFTTREGGTGLGVVVARALVEQHGGELRYESKVGKGTTATIELPACALEIAKAHKLPDPSREPIVSAQTSDGFAGGRTAG
jgi:signal transduction histidine kinase